MQQRERERGREKEGARREGGKRVMARASERTRGENEIDVKR